MVKKKSALKLANFIKNCTKKRLEDCEIEEIVHKIPTLSDEEVNKGKITLEEAMKALKNMKNNKS